MTSPIKFTIFFALAMLTLSFPAMAYMGPGAGITAVGCLIALGAGGWYTFKGFLWLPLKRMFKKTPSSEEVQQEQQAPSELAPSKEAEQANHNK